MANHDGFDDYIPPELAPWFEAQREIHKHNASIGLGYYILVNGKIKPATFMEWGYWFENIKHRLVDLTDISDEAAYPGGESVSTVFLGIDHNFDFDPHLEHIPILFETMVCGGKYNGRMWRCSTYGQAKRTHWQFVDCIRRGLPPSSDNGERPFIDEFMDMFRNEDEPDA